MSADRPIVIETIEHKKRWEDLWWNMSNGDILAYKEIKKMDVFDFWSFFDRWRAKQKEEVKTLKKNRNG